MKLEVPFHKQTTRLNCGPTVLRMVLNYLEKDYDIETIEEAAETKEGKGVSTIKLAIGAIKLGFKTKFLSKTLTLDVSNLDADFYKNYGDLNSVE